MTESADQESLYALTSALLECHELTTDVLREAARKVDTPLEFKLAAKLVDSRRYALNVEKKIDIGVVFAMWGEQNRLLPKSDTNPNGEDSLRSKITQMNWVTAATSIDWTLYAVDDGCSYNSGKIAQEIANIHPLGEKVKVLFLSEAVPTAGGPLKGLKSADDSRKAGAIILGCLQAISDGKDAVVYTDADNSVHLGQIGLLLRPFLDDDYRVVLGNRKGPGAVLVKEEGRWGIGIKLLRHIQRMVGQAIFSQNILDTQAAFKLYERNLLQQIIDVRTVFDFSFDTDWLLAAISMNEPLTKVPFAFIDSFAESASITQGPMTTWEVLLKGLVKAVRRHGVPHNEEMARVLDEEIQSSADLDILIHHLPPELVNADVGMLGDPAVMSPEAVQVWIQLRKAADAGETKVR
ncbi:glycosyltransferase [Desulfococcaceae bacterium HSG9]|nr:glycosyltransferase [Desulfococcaceae bacterium HSG9]